MNNVAQRISSSTKRVIWWAEALMNFTEQRWIVHEQMALLNQLETQLAASCASAAKLSFGLVARLTP